MSEAAITAAIRKKLTAAGWLVWKNHGTAMSAAGIPDLMALRGGVLLAIEVKAGGNKPTKLQEIWLQRLKANGAVAIVAYSASDVTDWC